jgi:hypothetical protein
MGKRPVARRGRRTVNGQQYEFDTNDFKNLLKKAVTEAGWIYRAVIFRAL